jgi:phosphoenolpyruvate phosphomutase
MNRDGLPYMDRGRLRQLLAQRSPVRFIEAHSAFSCLVGSRANASVDGISREFDGIWVSSLTSSATRGVPDMELHMFESRMDTIREILDATEKPVLVDGDTGGEAAAFEFLCRRLERAGAAGVVIEDKVFPKRNSLSEDSRQVLEDVGEFSRKISRGKRACRGDVFIIIARLEGLIAGLPVEDAVHRAIEYTKAGADAILIHSRARSPDEVLGFLAAYSAAVPDPGDRRPVFCVPTTYNQISADALFSAGFAAVIHANHLLRASHLAMRAVASSLLESDRSFEADGICTSVSEVFSETGYHAAVARDKEGASA